MKQNIKSPLHPPGPVTLVYDAECAFCRAQIRRLRRWDRQGAFEYLPFQSPGLAARFPALTGAALDDGLRLIEIDGRIWVGPDAIYAIMRRLPGWRHGAWLYRVPLIHGLARMAYRWMAKHRRRLTAPCRRCRVY